MSLFADLPGRLANSSPPATILPSISTTSSRPDLVLVSERELYLLELTICNNSPTGFSEARCRNDVQYAPLVLDLEDKGFSVVYITLEIGSLGYFTREAVRSLMLLCPQISKHKITDILLKLARTSVSFSKFIFQGHSSTVWDEHLPLYN